MVAECELLFHGVCHRIPERTLSLAGVALPTCARCTGLYLGVGAMYFALLLLRGRLGASRPWAAWLMVTVVGSWILAGLDVGLGALVPSAPIAVPRRLVTGLCLGMTLPVLLVFVANMTPGSSPGADVAILERPTELAVPVSLGCICLMALALRSSAVCQAVAFLCTLGLVAVMSHLNYLVIGLATEGVLRSRRWSWVSSILAVTFAVSELAAVATARALWLG